MLPTAVRAYPIRKRILLSLGQALAFKILIIRTTPTANKFNCLELRAVYSCVLCVFYCVDQVLARGGHFNVCGVSIHTYMECA